MTKKRFSSKLTFQENHRENYYNLATFLMKYNCIMVLMTEEQLRYSSPNYVRFLLKRVKLHICV